MQPRPLEAEQLAVHAVGRLGRQRAGGERRLCAGVESLAGGAQTLHGCDQGLRVETRRQLGDVVELANEVANRRGIRRHVVRQDLGIGEPQRHRAPELRHEMRVLEAGVAHGREPVVAVVGGVVDAVGTVELQFGDRQPHMVDEHGVVRPAADARGDERLIGQRAVLRPLRRLGGSAPRVIERHTRRVPQILRDLDDHRRQRADGRHVEVRPRRRRVHVQIRHRLLPQLVAEVLAPFGGAGERDLFAVPRAEHERALGAHALLLQGAERLGQLHQRRRAARRIDAAEHPRVVVVAEHHPLVGPLAADDAAFHDVVRLHVGLHVDLHVQPGVDAAEAIGDRQSALPGVWRRRAAELLEDRLDVAIRHRQGHHLRNRHRLRRGNARGAGERRPTRRERIARHDEVVGDAAALQMTGRTPRALRVHVALAVAVLRGIGVDDHRRRALAFGGQRLEAPVAVGIRVAHDHDLALRVDALRAQQVVVGGVAAVGVDGRRRHVARRGERRPGAADGRLR